MFPLVPLRVLFIPTSGINLLCLISKEGLGTPTPKLPIIPLPFTCLPRKYACRYVNATEPCSMVEVGFSCSRQCRLEMRASTQFGPTIRNQQGTKHAGVGWLIGLRR